MSNILTNTLKFPPVIFLLIFLVFLAAFQGYAQYAGAGQTQEVQHIEPTITADGHTYHPGSWMRITVNVAEDHHHGGEGHDDAEGEEAEEAEGHHHDDDEAEAEGHRHGGGEAEVAEAHQHGDEEAEDHHGVEERSGGFVLRITVYSPDGSVFAIKEGVTDHDGEATFDVFLGSESRAGTYTIVAEATLEGYPPVISETMTIEVI